MNNLGIYIHFPFCVRKCPYCSFYSLCYREDLADLYCEKIARTIKEYPFSHSCADTVYFGGGTPVLAGAKNIEKILTAVESRFDIKDAEITLEANPAYTLKEKLQDFKSAGINRVSFGVQSLDDECLNILGRTHSAQEAVSTVESACAVFENVSVDIMLGIPRQTVMDVENFTKTFSKVGATHISAYMLKIEEGTPFYRNGIVEQCPDEDTVCDVYLDTVKLMEQAGYQQYEISNFAKVGYESRHNIKYWQCEDYIGLGPSAHSCIGGKRYSFENTVEQFLNLEKPYEQMQFQGEGCDMEEYVMLALRLKKGLDLRKLKSLYPEAEVALFCQRAKKLQDNGLVDVYEDTISLTPRGFLVSNSVILFILYEL